MVPRLSGQQQGEAQLADRPTHRLTYPSQAIQCGTLAWLYLDDALYPIIGAHVTL